ncbi:MAG: tetratricopeptide repeat protein [Opitutaceae bacterium]|jgi:tetratricopeptide (TPR) repeat protein|nr:tetratricopeptide repeat protein [Opitutaceae bacterium]
MKRVPPVIALLVPLLPVSGAWSQPVDGNTPWPGQFEHYVNAPIPAAPTVAGGGGISAGFDALLHALPEPVRWPVLWQTLAEERSRATPGSDRQRRLQAGVWLLAWLNGDRETLAREIGEKLSGEPLASAPALQALQRAAIPAAELSPRNRVRRFNQVLADIENATRRPSPPPLVPTPDIAASLTPATAEAVLTRALRLPVVLDLRSAGAETAALARKLALAKIATLQAPQWLLAADSQGADLFEALANRFREGNEQQAGYTLARNYYLGALVLANRVDPALALVANLPPEAVVTIPAPVRDEIMRRNRGETLWLVLQGVTRRAPSGAAWEVFFRLSQHLGRLSAFTSLAQEIADDRARTPAVRFRAARCLAAAELAGATPDAGIARLRKLLAEKQVLPAIRDEQATIARQLLEIADLRGDAALFDETLAAGRSLIEARRTSQPALWPEAVGALARHLLTLKHPAEALALTAPVTDPAAPAAAAWSPAARQQLLADHLAALVALEKWGDAVALLRDNPGWGAADLADLIRTGVRSGDTPAGYLAARALLEHTGDKSAARQILEAQVFATPSFDAAYRTWLRIAGIDTLTLLDRLVQQDRYEPRPLIWKSRVETMLGNTEAALATLRIAAGVDPTDNASPPADRMRVYEFVSEALKKKGDLETAEFFGNVLKAVHLTSEGDRWSRAGLTPRGLERYQEALKFFPNGSAALWRATFAFERQGRHDEAITAFRRACEFMADSINRLGSPFVDADADAASGSGGPRWFGGPATQAIAEETFDKLSRRQPGRPQYAFLTGILREEQGRTAEAVKFYQRAVQIDPFQLGAWGRLAGLLDRTDLSAKERDEVFFNILELDPAGRYFRSDLSRVSDQERLWKQLDKNERRRAAVAVPATLWPLKASAARLDGNPGAQAGQAGVSSTTASSSRNDPAHWLGRQEFVRTLEAYLRTLQ